MLLIQIYLWDWKIQWHRRTTGDTGKVHMYMYMACLMWNVHKKVCKTCTVVSKHSKCNIVYIRLVNFCSLLFSFQHRQWVRLATKKWAQDVSYEGPHPPAQGPASGTVSGPAGLLRCAVHGERPIPYWASTHAKQRVARQTFKTVIFHPLNGITTHWRQLSRLGTSNGAGNAISK